MTAAQVQDSHVLHRQLVHDMFQSCSTSSLALLLLDVGAQHNSSFCMFSRYTTNQVLDRENSLKATSFSGHPTLSMSHAELSEAGYCFL